MLYREQERRSTYTVPINRNEIGEKKERNNPPKTPHSFECFCRFMAWFVKNRRLKIGKTCSGKGCQFVSGILSM